MSNGEAWEDAGLYDPCAPGADERLELLMFLAEAGLSVDDMRPAHAEGRLFALAGDRVIRGGVPEFSLDDVARELGRDGDVVVSVWDALGFDGAESRDSTVATAAEVRALRTALVLVDLLGNEAAIGLLRTYGLLMERVAEAEAAAFRREVTDVSLRRSGSELTTAKRWLALGHFVTEVTHLLDVTHRHRIDASRRLLEAAGTETELSYSDREVRLGVAFIDLSGFTALSQALPANDLAGLLGRFERITQELAGRHHCRVVKFIGDAAMVVAPDPASLATMVTEVVRSFSEPTSARAGLAYGNLVAREGDYFGTPVNLAARLIAAAPPSSIVTSQAYFDLLPTPWRCHSLGRREFRGIDQPITVMELSCTDE